MNLFRFLDNAICVGVGRSRQKGVVEQGLFGVFFPFGKEEIHRYEQYVDACVKLSKLIIAKEICCGSCVLPFWGFTVLQRTLLFYCKKSTTCAHAFGGGVCAINFVSLMGLCFGVGSL